MTPTAPRQERRAPRKSTIAVTGISLAGLMAFGSWVVKITQETRDTQKAAVSVAVVERYVTEQRWLADSARRDLQFMVIIGELRELKTDNAARLREICVALRAGCR